jgi:hypothetical protein
MTIWSRITPKPGNSTTSLGPLLSGPAAVLIQIAESCEREARRIFELLGNQKSIMNYVLQTSLTRMAVLTVGKNSIRWPRQFSTAADPQVPTARVAMERTNSFLQVRTNKLGIARLS